LVRALGLDGGHDLVVYDISQTAMEPLLLRQARQAASPKDVGNQSEIVVVSLPTLAAFRAAVLGPDGLAGGRAMKVLLHPSRQAIREPARSCRGGGAPGQAGGRALRDGGPVQ
jgi:3-hydroxyisobutyrate dehydrogenase-like beta-hydroxyacid dehydrogenase